MRKTFSNTVETIARNDERIIFITGDVGYNAFENLQDTLGERFINAGVAEQNMLSVAAGMAYKGYKVFCYSIAPFVVYRCLEQFRNDVCFHNLPVCLVGNSGGYGYGIMGSSHHTLEDLACLSGMQNVRTWVPAFNDDVQPALTAIVAEGKPSYLRLGMGKAAPNPQTTCSSFNQVIKASRAEGTIIALGPVANNVIAALQDKNLKGRFNLFTAVSLPMELSGEFINSIAEGENLVVVEEHISTGGIAQQLSVKLLEQNIKLNQFISLTAKGYPGGLYGDQSYHQKQSGLDGENITRVLKGLI